MLAFFSMVEKGKKLHRDIMDHMGKQCSGLLHNTIPYVTEIEKMGLVRAPVPAFKPRTARDRKPLKMEGEAQGEGKRIEKSHGQFSRFLSRSLGVRFTTMG